jgi:GxxExxY protein
MDINEITYRINGAVFEVNRILGPGFLEKVYKNALMVELKDRGLRAMNQVPMSVSYKETIVGDYLADILVEDEVIVELKTVEKIDKIHEAQVLNYLKTTGKRVGLRLRDWCLIYPQGKTTMSLPSRQTHSLRALAVPKPRAPVLRSKYCGGWKGWSVAKFEKE